MSEENSHLEDQVRISPNIWSNMIGKIQPGDLSVVAPYGSGVYAGLIQNKQINPFTSAPLGESSGGIIYLDSLFKKEDFETALELMGVRGKEKDYAAFTLVSQNPLKDRYLKQMRLISKFGLEYAFDAITKKEYDIFPEQQLNVSEALLAFVEDERKTWGTFWRDKSKLQGKFGGDGEYACEQLGFGFMVENAYHEIYRIWSRTWLVTK